MLSRPCGSSRHDDNVRNVPYQLQSGTSWRFLTGASMVHFGRCRRDGWSRTGRESISDLPRGLGSGTLGVIGRPASHSSRHDENVPKSRLSTE